MPDLIAQGPRPQDRWRRQINAATTGELGRAASEFGTPWDDRISRQHATLGWDGKQLTISKLIDARNYIFHRGQRKDDFSITVGDHFVIGQTTFSLVDQRVHVHHDGLPAVTEHTFAASHLRQSRYRDADRRIEVLSRIPEIIEGSTSDQELFVRLVNVVMQGIERATFVAIVADSDQAQSSPPSPTPTTGMPANSDETVDNPDLPANSMASAKSAKKKSEKLNRGPTAKQWEDESSSTSESNTVRIDDNIGVLHWDSRNLVGMQFSPSAQLIRQAIETQESVLHIWSRSIDQSNENYTQSENVDWAFCSPISSETMPGWAIYVAGDFRSFQTTSNNATSAAAIDLHDDLKFAELAATTLGSLRQTRFLERRQNSLRPFFAPVVLKALATQEPDQVLQPRECDVSVLFCDLRGFSRQSEESADRLLELLQRVSDALGVMTHHILDSGGVVGDFHGDAAMGFWGWPFPGQNTVHQACVAALAIQREFESAAAQKDNALAHFRAGLGIASGRAVAGQIGTKDQVKVTVFGPVVNLASRLESMTKQLRATILLDEATAQAVEKTLDPSIGRLRRIARVQPVGMNTPLMVSELLPPAGPESILTDEHIDAYEQAVDALQTGRWGEAFRLLHQVPAEDRVKDFLTVFIAQHGRTPPPDWDGYIRLPEK